MNSLSRLGDRAGRFFFSFFPKEQTNFTRGIPEEKNARETIKRNDEARPLLAPVDLARKEAETAQQNNLRKLGLLSCFSVERAVPKKRRPN